MITLSFAHLIYAAAISPGLVSTQVLVEMLESDFLAMTQNIT